MYAYSDYFAVDKMEAQTIGKYIMNVYYPDRPDWIMSSCVFGEKVAVDLNGRYNYPEIYDAVLKEAYMHENVLVQVGGDCIDINTHMVSRDIIKIKHKDM